MKIISGMLGIVLVLLVTISVQAQEFVDRSEVDRSIVDNRGIVARDNPYLSQGIDPALFAPPVESFQNSDVPVSTVPEPSTFILLFSAIVFFGLIQFRTRKVD